MAVDTTGTASSLVKSAMLINSNRSVLSWLWVVWRFFHRLQSIAGISIFGPSVAGIQDDTSEFHGLPPITVPSGTPGLLIPVVPPVNLPKSFPASPVPPCSGARGPAVILFPALQIAFYQGSPHSFPESRASLESQVRLGSPLELAHLGESAHMLQLQEHRPR